MKKNEVPTFIKMTSWTFIAVLVVRMIVYRDINLETIKFLFSTSAVVIAFWWCYFLYGWKMPLIKYIFFRPNINGTWYGDFSSVDMKSEYVGKIVVVIKQSFFSVKVSSHTEHSVTRSVIESFVSDSEQSCTRLVYSYMQESTNFSISDNRKGVSDLELLGENDKPRLFGSFWTNVSTIGRINVEKVHSKHATSWSHAMNEFIGR